MYKTILVPTDGTEFCEKAIGYAMRLAKLSGARVIGLTVTLPLHTGTPRFMIPSEIAGVVHAETVKAGEANLAAVKKAADAAGVAVETIRKSHDHPWEAIVETATDKECDLIVMASHGRRGVSALVLGSETQKVLTHSSVPVLVVR